jgi:hypothetical protein
MEPQRRFRVNQPQVIRESFESEVVIINLDTGNYYSLEKTGALIWDWIEQGATLDGIVAQLAERGTVPAAEMAAALKQFVSELERERLIMPDGEAAGQAPMPAGAAPFAPPILNRYEDMQQLLLLDPIHDVDANGWPNRVPGTR